MKNINEMTLGDAIYYCRKKVQAYSSRDKIARATGIDKWRLASIENNEDLPTKKEWALIAPLLQNQELEQRGYEMIEYKRTHPEVKLCLADNTTCWKCKKKMHSAHGLVNGSPIPPDFFNETMLKICKEKGVILQERKSNTTGESHIVNVCPHCGAFIGEFYLHDLWYGETEMVEVTDFTGFVEK